ncbi:MAG: prephenate dehydratase [Bacillota bacterium]|nr:prephenate dehydratase [Bacillota bacterium]
MKVGYLGPKATFTEVAVNQLFPGFLIQPYRTIPECIDAAVDQEVDFAVVPLENALEGSVNMTLDYLTRDADVPIVAEITVPIKQHFMVHPENEKNWRNIEKVYSHPHAIAQCHKFLHRDFKEALIENTNSTAAAALFVKNYPEVKAAAIANELASKEYGLTIVKSDIHDYDFNHTRFIVLSKKMDDIISKKDGFISFKTTIMVTLPSDQAGALHQVLSAFAWRKINLSKIESRPMKTGIGNYFFIIDLDQKMDQTLIPNAILELEALGCGVKVLGSYPSFLIDIE